MQRRGWIAVALAATVLATGCTGSGNPAPTPSVSSAPVSNLPPATAVLAQLTSALTTLDVTSLPLEDPAAAQLEIETIFAGMDGITPEVTVKEVDYSTTADTARATLTFAYPLGENGWTYETVAPLTLVDDEWRIDWTPTIIHPELTSDSRMRHQRSVARRAAINDNEGLALVEERELYQVGIDKTLIPATDWALAAEQLAALLEIDTVEFQAKVAGGGERQFVVAKTMRQEEISPDIGSITGVQVVPVSAMVPISETFAASLLGIVGSPTQEMLEASDGDVFASDTVGLSGLQNRYEEQLRGVPEIRVDLVGRVSEDDTTASETFVEQSLFLQDFSVPEPVETSLDRALQTKAEAILAEQPGLAALVVIRNEDGAILTAANSPAAGTFPQATFGKFAPGSTFKVVSSLAMLRSGLTPASTVQCPASLTVSGREFTNYSDYPTSQLGGITLKQALASSCNTVFAGAAGEVTPEQLHAAAASLGVGTDYDAGFTSNFGTVEPNDSPIDRAASMIGQGQITMSPLAMASVAASVASGKTTIAWLVAGEQALSKGQALTAAETAQLQEMMMAVVTEGSGKSLAGLMKGAKTGTAEFGTVGAYETHGWMIAWNDTVSVAAFVEEGVSGSQSAAPLIIALFS